MAYITEAQFLDYCSPVARYMNENRPLRGWETHAGSVYKTGQTGVVAVLYQNGNDLGDPEANLAAVTANGDWFYDSSINTVYLFNDANSPNVDDMQVGEDHTTYVADLFERATLLINQDLDATHITPIATDVDGNYEELIKQLTAYKAAVLITLIAAPDLRLIYETLLMNETDDGLLDRIIKGELKFKYEIDSTSSLGEITENTLSGTMRLVELRGRASGVTYDKALVKITLGGAIGTATYSVWVADDSNDTLQTLLQVEDEIINGLFQELAYGVQIRFDGVSATLNDNWDVIVRGQHEQTSNPTIGTIVGGRGGSSRRTDPWL